jgi:hypothetical protein
MQTASTTSSASGGGTGKRNFSPPGSRLHRLMLVMPYPPTYRQLLKTPPMKQRTSMNKEEKATKEPLPIVNVHDPEDRKGAHRRFRHLSWLFSFAGARARHFRNTTRARRSVISTIDSNLPVYVTWRARADAHNHRQISGLQQSTYRIKPTSSAAASVAQAGSARRPMFPQRVAHCSLAQGGCITVRKRS